MWTTGLAGLEELLTSLRDLTVQLHQAALIEVANKAEAAAKATSHQQTLKMHIHEPDKTGTTT